ncbi:MAG: ChaB family protein [Candidatus Babeliales bacterium]
MPYSSNDDLPGAVKNHLPDHAQSIYLKAFNNAEKQYNNESSAHKVAWAAVEKEYKKNKEGKWVKK